MKEPLLQLAARYRWPDQKPDLMPDLHGWCAEDNKSLFDIVIEDTTQTIVEVGSWLGLSALALLEKAPDATVICLDHWLGSEEHHIDPDWQRRLPFLYETFLVNLWDHRDRVIPLRKQSLAGLKEIHDLGINPDLIYIDASHQYEDVFNDIRLAIELFPKSVICGDDWTWPGVRQAVSELAEQHGQKIIIEGKNAWHFVRPIK